MTRIKLGIKLLLYFSQLFFGDLYFATLFMTHLIISGYTEKNGGINNTILLEYTYIESLVRILL